MANHWHYYIRHWLDVVMQYIRTDVMHCPRCNIEMKWGIAISPDMEANALYIHRPPMINTETLELIDVLKCPKCGYSDDGVNANKCIGIENRNERTNQRT